MRAACSRRDRSRSATATAPPTPPTPHLIRGGLFLALVGREGHQLGSLALFWRTPGYEPSPERMGRRADRGDLHPGPRERAPVPGGQAARETDALTGFFNQRYFHETLRREALRAQRYDRQLALLILDLDDFKAVNDRVGHLAGDAVLAQVAEQLRNEIRSVDIGCRVGGDEFAVVMPESTDEDASQLFDRMRDGVAADADAGRPARCGSPPASPSSVTARRRPASSSGPMRPCGARRTRARTGRRARPSSASALQVMLPRSSYVRSKPG